MKYLITISWCFLLFFTCTVFAGNFTDVNGHWAEEDITRMVTNRVIDGYEDGSFKPNNFVTIAEFLKILLANSKKPLIQEGRKWPDFYINSAVFYGYALEDEFANYNAFITRYEAAKIISRYVDVSNVFSSKKCFSDLNAKNRVNVLKLVELNIVNGYEDNTFRGNNFITRAESLKIIYNACIARKNLLLKKDIPLKNAMSLTNQIGRDLQDIWIKNSFKIENGKIYICDSGRYANLDMYLMDQSYVKNRVILQALQQLVCEDYYTCLSYVPDDNMPNEIIIVCGESEGYIYNGLINFSFTWYENDLYDLSYYTGLDVFSDDCFLKISVCKMWSDLYDYRNGMHFDEFNIARLLKGVNAVLGEDFAVEFKPYLEEKIHQANTKEYGTNFCEQVRIGQYTVNVFGLDSNGVDFYFCK